MKLEEAKGLIPSSYGGTRTPRPSYLDKGLPFAVDVPRCSQADEVSSSVTTSSEGGRDVEREGWRCFSD